MSHKTTLRSIRRSIRRSILRFMYAQGTTYNSICWHRFTSLHSLSAHLQVKQFQTLRRSLPESTTLLVCKNSLLGKAIEGTKFEALTPAMTGMNAYLFIHTEEVPAALKPYRSAPGTLYQSESLVVRVPTPAGQSRGPLCVTTQPQQVH